MVKSLVLLAILYVPALAAGSEECTMTRPEKFGVFFGRFANDKQFAMSRTDYPLLVVLFYQGEDHTGRFSVKTTFNRSAEDDKQLGTLSSEMKEGMFKSRVLFNGRMSAVVEMKSKSRVITNRFLLDGGCWSLRERTEDEL